MQKGKLTKADKQHVNYYNSDSMFNNFLYFWQDVDPLGAVPVVNYIVAKATELKNPFAFKLTKFGARTFYFIADSETEMSRYVVKYYYY